MDVISSDKIEKMISGLSDNDDNYALLCLNVYFSIKQNIEKLCCIVSIMMRHSVFYGTFTDFLIDSRTFDIYSSIKQFKDSLVESSPKVPQRFLDMLSCSIFDLKKFAVAAYNNLHKSLYSLYNEINNNDNWDVLSEIDKRLYHIARTSKRNPDFIC